MIDTLVNVILTFQIIQEGVYIDSYIVVNFENPFRSWAVAETPFHPRDAFQNQVVVGVKKICKRNLFRMFMLGFHLTQYVPHKIPKLMLTIVTNL